MNVSAATNVFAVIGDPVAHSLSPLIHNAWIAALGADAVYVALRVDHPHPENAIRSLAASGLAGLNVTLPHKTAALAAASEIDKTAKAVGAANTLVRNASGGWTAHNTDIKGFARAVETALDARPTGARVLLLGAGGAARAAAFHLGETGADLAILNRTRANADELARQFAPNAEVAEMSELARLSEQADLVVNAASIGHAGGRLPEFAQGKGRPFLDLSYGRAAQSAIDQASDAGWTTHDGLEMLVAQAAAAFRLWYGESPDQASALAACRDRLAVTS